MTKQLDTAKMAKFWEDRARISGIQAARFHPEFTPYDLETILPYIRAGDSVLDLGCGTCVLANILAEHHAVNVHGVEKAAPLLRYASGLKNLTTEVSDVVGYQTNRRFDVVLLFGVINYIPEIAERRKLYAACRGYLRENGMLIVKSQFGRDEDVIVDRHSEELGTHYQAIYPHIAIETNLFPEDMVIKTSEPYPAEFNRWDNTRFHVIHAQLKHAEEIVAT